MLRIALPNKGSLSEGAVSIVSEAGYACGRAAKELAKLDAANDVEFFFLRPRDIAVYVSRGVIAPASTALKPTSMADGKCRPTLSATSRSICRTYCSPTFRLPASGRRM